MSFIVSSTIYGSGGDPLSPVSVLIMIRDRQSINISELNTYFGRPSSLPIEISRIDGRLENVLNLLTEAGLIEYSDNNYRPSPKLSKIQSVLDLSLTELSKRDQNAMTVFPLFGKPYPQAPQKDIFVLMPFSPELRPIYTDHISHVAKNLGLSIARADDFYNTHEIMQDVWQGIATSKLLIADCTDRNPNVFYEIGIAHSIGKPVILISQKLDDIPFDLQHRRIIVYQYTPPGMKEFQKELTATIKSTLGQ
jgi:hypothetical protein